MCAIELATVDPTAAAALIASVENPFDRGRYGAQVAYRMAQKDPEAAIRLAEKAGEGGTYAAYGQAWVALSVAQRDKPAAHRIIDRAFQTIHDHASGSLGYGSIGGWGECAAHVALIAFSIDHPDRADLATHVYAVRPTEAEVQSEIRVVEANVGLAALLALADRRAARSFLEAAETRQDVIGQGGQGIDRRVYLAAWALVDPERARSGLLEEIERLKKTGKTPSEHDRLFDILGVMTATPSNRPRLLDWLMRQRWPGAELEI
jgi:hypothetical protein